VLAVDSFLARRHGAFSYSLMIDECQPQMFVHGWRFLSSSRCPFLIFLHPVSQ
jgi:hypothetical protein